MCRYLDVIPARAARQNASSQTRSLEPRICRGWKIEGSKSQHRDARNKRVRSAVASIRRKPAADQNRSKSEVRKER